MAGVVAQVTREQTDRLAVLAAMAHAAVMARAKKEKPDGFTAAELMVATHQAWRAAVEAIAGGLA